jgi:hypothetical protein
MVKRKAKRILIDEFFKQSSERGEIRLICGIDKKPPDPHPNAIFYLRMESQDRKSGEPFETEDIWLSLNEMTKLSILMNIASQFWLERLEKGRTHSEKRIKEFQEEYQKIKESLDKILPKER